MTISSANLLGLLVVDHRAPVDLPPEVEQDLTDRRLIERNAAGLLVVADRGAVFLDMLEHTPLPEPRTAWGDPRQPAEPFHPGLPYPPPPAPAATSTPVPSVPPTLPAGFTPNTFTDLKPGETPPNLPRDIEVQTFIRAGRVVTNFVGAIAWGHRGSPHDVIGYRIASTEDSMSPVVHRAG